MGEDTSRTPNAVGDGLAWLVTFRPRPFAAHVLELACATRVLVCACELVRMGGRPRDFPGTSSA